MFEQDVAGLIKALRANKNGEAKVIEQALEETRKEIKNKDLEVKAAALLKLVYLEMLGHSIAFASFAIVECMSSTKYHLKSIGYLAASQCFDKETEVAVLVVNLVKKDLLSPPTPLFSSSPSSLTIAHLLSTLSAVSLLLTPSLARDLAPDLLSMLTHSRPAIRKQTTLVLWRVVRSYPAVMELSTGREERGEDPWIERLRERLGDDEIGVVSATVNLVCELARKDPAKYLGLAPELFGLLTGSINNWMLIKIVKLFAVLTPMEPRLVKKLVPPLKELIETTSAMSLLYECIQTSIVGGILTGKDGEALASTCVDKLKSFLEDLDQNLRYIALVALVKILPTHPHLVAKHHATILTCIDDPDMSIRLRALDLVEGMVDRKTLQSIVQRLMTHLRPSSSSSVATASLSAASHLQAQQAPDSFSPPSTTTLTPSYRASLIALILRMCSSSTYANVSNFEWYIDTLVELSYLALLLPSTKESSIKGATSLGIKLRDQLIDVTARVKAIRPYAVKQMVKLLEDEAILENGDGDGIEEVLGAAAWISAEYCRVLEDPRPIIAHLFSSTSNLSPRILTLYAHNGIKLYAYWLTTLVCSWDETDLDQIRSVTSALESQLLLGATSNDIEYQERSAELGQLLAMVRQGLDAPRPKQVASPIDGEAEEERGFGGQSLNSFGPGTLTADSLPPLPPTCLSHLATLFFEHELNPVNEKAQGMVSVPEGLDLDRVIIGGRRSEISLNGSLNVEVDDYGRPIGRNLAVPERSDDKSGKLKGKNGAIRSGLKKGKRREVVEDPEEMARLKAERLERQRDDPYYVGPSSAPSFPLEEQDDIESIGIVNLSLDLPSSQHTQTPLPPPRVPTPPPVFIDVDGEMPDIVHKILEDTPEPKRIEVVEEGENVSVDNQASEGTILRVVKKKKKDPNAPKSKKKKAVVLE